VKEVSTRYIIYIYSKHIYKLIHNIIQSNFLVQPHNVIIQWIVIIIYYIWSSYITNRGPSDFNFVTDANDGKKQIVNLIKTFSIISCNKRYIIRLLIGTSSIDIQVASRSKVKVYRNEQYMNISPTADSAFI